MMITFFAKAGVVAAAIAGVIAISGAIVSSVIFYSQKQTAKQAVTEIAGNLR